MRDYNLKEAASILGIKVRTAREWVRTGKIYAEKNGHYWIIPEGEIHRKIIEIINKKEKKK